MKKIKNRYGVEFEYLAARVMMDESICHYLTQNYGIYSEEEFFRLYCDEHWKRYGEEFDFNKKNPLAKDLDSINKFLRSNEEDIKKLEEHFPYYIRLRRMTSAPKPKRRRRSAKPNTDDEKEVYNEN